MVSVKCWGGQKKKLLCGKEVGKMLMVFGWLNYFLYFRIFIGLFLFFFLI